ncbi:MAG: DUF3667 domain-containing protein, partial [Pseudomonadota bacterium]
VSCHLARTKKKGTQTPPHASINRRSIFALVLEFFENMTAIDGRMWRSLRSLLFRPGQMARNFADGARQRWTSPVRLYIASSLLLFGYITLTETQIIAVGSIEQSQAHSIIKFGETADQSYSPRLLFFVQKKNIIIESEDALEEAQAFFDSIGNDFNDAIEGMDTGDLSVAIEEISAQIEDATDPIEREVLRETRRAMMIAQAQMRDSDGVADTDKSSATPSETDLADATESSSVDSDNVQPSDQNESQVELEMGVEPNDDSSGVTFTGLNGETVNLDWEGMQELYQLVLERPELINNRVNNDLKFAMFFMMPLAMLLGAIFIRSRETAMLYDHLVHAAYVHAFSFLLLFMFIILGQYTAIPALLGIYTLIILVYLPVSAKNAFQRGWFKSFLTAYGVGAFYTLVIFIIFVMVIVSALSSVAADVSAERERREAAINATLTTSTRPSSESQSRSTPTPAEMTETP